MKTNPLFLSLFSLKRETLLALNILLILSISSAYCQSTDKIPGAKYAAMSNTGAADQGVWQGLLNPAGIMDSTDFWQAGLAYSSHFTLSELSSRDLVFTSPLGKGKLGLMVHSFGYSSYTQNQFSAGYALKLSDQLNAGIQLNYISLNISEGYGNFSALTANLGLQYRFNDQISAGISIYNPTRSSTNMEIQEYVESSISGGIKFKLADNLTLLTDLSKDLEFDPNLTFGLEYIPVKDWFVRGGLSTLDKSSSFGFGYKFGKWSIDIASMYHQILGFSPIISIDYNHE